MKWRFVDRIEQFEQWHSICCIKTVSFEEYSLLERWGRGGEFSAALALEAAVEATRWLAVVSSDFALSATLAEVDSLRIPRTATRGEVLRTTAGVQERTESSIEIVFTQEAGGSPRVHDTWCEERRCFPLFEEGADVSDSERRGELGTALDLSGRQLDKKRLPTPPALTSFVSAPSPKRGKRNGSPVMSGKLRLHLSPLAGTHDATSMRLLWQEIGPDG